jgi:hypothetical protein
VHADLFDEQAEELLGLRRRPGRSRPRPPGRDPFSEAGARRRCSGRRPAGQGGRTGHGPFRRRPGRRSRCSSGESFAMGALSACRTRGLVVPDDVALVSFDDPPFGDKLDPPLTALEGNDEEMGRLQRRSCCTRCRRPPCRSRRRCGCPCSSSGGGRSGSTGVMRPHRNRRPRSGTTRRPSTSPAGGATPTPGAGADEWRN